ncbi:MAG: thiamine biosynthesis lipoprotein [Ignavibacteria bacterium]|nr:MAG: thiamine biosynthesis lipoprotein [Ignavibacteria bacterium]KAF0161788.1 MAG: thiamine biosynthesis lipoprotein [Ignavibacteria bacterium]
MATVFDLLIVHENKRYAQQAAWEAVKVIDHLEDELSRFKPNSDISRINNLMLGERIVLSFDVFNCIVRSIELHNETNGAFNIACGALLKCWLNADYTLKNPTEEEIENAIKQSRLENIVLHKEDYTLEILQEGTTIDLGALGKGYAIDAAAEILSEWNINCALLSAGRSSIRAIGKPERHSGWSISISNPAHKNVIKTFSLSDISLCASGLIKGNHIINTLTGKPEVKKAGSWVFSQNTADADALSTAFMILNDEEISKIIKEGVSAIVINNDSSGNLAATEFGLLPRLCDLV